MMEKEKTYFLYDGKAKMCLFTNGKNCTDKDNINCNYFIILQNLVTTHWSH